MPGLKVEDKDVKVTKLLTVGILTVPQKPTRSGEIVSFKEDGAPVTSATALMFSTGSLFHLLLTTGRACR